jgi:hypothetical protein
MRRFENEREEDCIVFAGAGCAGELAVWDGFRAGEKNGGGYRAYNGLQQRDESNAAEYADP